jgi:hypothetical protein
MKSMLFKEIREDGRLMKSRKVTWPMNWRTNYQILGPEKLLTCNG